MRNAFITGLARDCEKYLPRVLMNLGRLEAIFENVFYLVLENDSLDKTKQVLMDWGGKKSNFLLMSFDGLGANSIRGLRLEFLRNVAIEFLKSNMRFNSFDYYINLDLDDANSFTIDMSEIKRSIEFLEKDEANSAVFANQFGHYYDIWALRQSELCPHDAWEEVLDYVEEHRVTDLEAFENTFKKRILNFKKGEIFIPVNSAFGGLGIYKIKKIVSSKIPYIGSKVKILNNSVIRFQQCEHVSFNTGLVADGGKLFINPNLINGHYSAPIYNPSSFRDLIF